MKINEVKEAIMQMIPDLDTGEQVANLIDQIELDASPEVDKLRVDLDAVTKDRDMIRERYIKRFLGDPEDNKPDERNFEENSDEEVTLEEILS